MWLGVRAFEGFEACFLRMAFKAQVDFQFVSTLYTLL